MPSKPTPKRKPWQEERVPHQRSIDNSRIYNGRKWRNFRDVRLQEEPLCRFCTEKGLVVEATVLDHIVRIVDGGAVYTRANTQPLCTKCHNSKSGRERHQNKIK